MFNKIRHMKWFIPIMSVLLVGILVGGVFAAVSISNVWISPDITVTVYVPPTPSNLDLIISSPDFTTTRNVTTGEATLAGVTLTNPSPDGAPGYTGVKVQFTINKTEIVVSDVSVEYSIDAGATWLPLTLTQSGANELLGIFGPAEGFPVGYGYNVTTPLRATFATAGVYHATAQAVQ